MARPILIGFVQICALLIAGCAHEPPLVIHEPGPVVKIPAPVKCDAPDELTTTMQIQKPRFYAPFPSGKCDATIADCDVTSGLHQDGERDLIVMLARLKQRVAAWGAWADKCGGNQ